ncbi:hypothetical protein lerEdw1_016983, partial [Lerista edwardsae]
NLTGVLILSVFTAVLGFFQYGYCIGVINAPQKASICIIQEYYYVRLAIEPAIDRNSNNLSDILNNVYHHPRIVMLWSFSVAMFAVGGMITSFTVSWVGENMGRIKAMLIVNVLSITGNFLLGIAKMGPPHVLIIIGRLLTGLFCGFTSGLCPLYVGEIAPTALRGAMGTLNQLAVVIGILISQILGLPSLLGGEKMWPLLLCLSGLTAVLQILLLFGCPESPRYLYIKVGQVEDAEKSLKRLRGSDYDTTQEMEAMKREKEEAAKEPPVSVLQLVTSTSLRPAFLVAIMVHIAQQFSGINAIFYYSTDIFHQAKVKEPVYATIGVGAINTVFTVVALFLVEKAGRRSLFVAGLAGMMVCAVTMTLGLVYQPKHAWMSYISLISIFAFVSFFEIGPGPIPWFIVAELFSQGPRPAAVAVAGFSNWATNFMIGMFFPYVAALCGPYVFLIFAGLLVLFILFIYYKVPETKGKTFEEISAEFRRRAAGSNAAELEHLEGAQA